MVKREKKDSFRVRVADIETSPTEFYSQQCQVMLIVEPTLPALVLLLGSDRCKIEHSELYPDRSRH